MFVSSFWLKQGSPIQQVWYRRNGIIGDRLTRVVNKWDVGRRYCPDLSGRYFLPSGFILYARASRPRPHGYRSLHTDYRSLVSSGTTFKSSFSVWRRTVSALTDPTRASVKRRCRSSTPATGLPSIATITSPSRNPAFWPGLPFSTDITITPLSLGRS